MYKIGELSKLCNLPVKTLRYYDSEGLLIPDKIDIFTGYRYYSAAKLHDCNRIIALKELGFSLEEIRKHLSAASTEDLLTLIDAKQIELTQALDQTMSQIRRLNAVRKIITDGGSPMFDVIIRNSYALRVAFIRKIFPTKEAAYEEAVAMKECLPKQIVGQRILIINYETEYRESNFDLAACVEITGKLPANTPFEERQITIPGEIATLICHKDELEDAYKTMTRELDEKPAQIIGAFYEFCHEDGTVELKVPICSLSRMDDKHQDDPIDYVFENDPDVIGAWEFVDLVPSRDQFSPNNRKYSDTDNIWLKKLYFLPEGKEYWIVKGWTKNAIYTCMNYPSQTYKHQYTVEMVNGEILMFIEMKNYSHESRGGKPLIYVFRKMDSIEYKKSDIRIRDKVDLPFVADDRILGKWTACDFCMSAEQFTPPYKWWKGELFFQTVEFMPDGRALAVCDGRSPYEPNWTNGYLLDRRAEIAEAYEIKVINGKEYLFIEWKSGDYRFGGRAPDYYIFERA